MNKHTIPMRCPKCDEGSLAYLGFDDPPHAKSLEILCPECSDGDFAEPMFFDENGEHITTPPEEWPKAV